MAMKKTKHLRWHINALLFFACVICYLDRNTLAVVAPTMMEDLGINEVGYGYVNSVFYFTYAVIYTLGGWFMDKLGTRRGFSIIMLLWTVASIGHAWVRNVAHLMAARFFLAIGEGGNYPGATKVTAEWFPPKERSIAVGYFNTGSLIGATIAPPIVATITYYWGWQEAFLVTGSLGFIWFFIWRAVAYRPEVHKKIYRSEYLYIKGKRDTVDYPDDDPGLSAEDIAGTSPAEMETASPKVSAIKLFKYPETWALFISRFLGDQVWYFYAAWVAVVLQRVYNYSLLEVGAVLWIPFAMGDLGSIVGGWTSRFFLKRGMDALNARKATALFYALMMPLTIFGGFTGGHSWIFLVTAALACFAHTAWIANVHTISMDCFDSRYVGTVAGFGGTGGSIGGGISQAMVGNLVITIGYTPVIVVYGFFHIIATIVIYVLARQYHDVDKEFAR